jgi:20S proteasome subunit alpha 6
VQSDTHVVIAALKRASSELSSFQPKVFKIDEHMGIAIAGLTADGRVLCRFMRNECVNHHFVYDSPLATGRLVQQVADRSQANTQRSWKRPYGVGLLVAGYDATGPHLYQTCPSGNFYEYKAMAIGARSQASKTYLEKTFDTFPSASLEELCRHALTALREACSEGELSGKNVSLAFVGAGTKFTLLEDAALAPHLAALADAAEVAPVAAPADGDAAPPVAPAAADGGADAMAADPAPPPPPAPADGGDGGGAAPMEG